MPGRISYGAAPPFEHLHFHGTLEELAEVMRDDLNFILHNIDWLKALMTAWNERATNRGTMTSVLSKRYHTIQDNSTRLEACIRDLSPYFLPWAPYPVTSYHMLLKQFDDVLGYFEEEIMAKMAAFHERLQHRRLKRDWLEITNEMDDLLILFEDSRKSVRIFFGEDNSDDEDIFGCDDADDEASTGVEDEDSDD